MPMWEKIVFTLVALAMVYFLYPSVLASLEKSKQAQVKHWGTVLLLAAALAGFVLLLINMVRN